MAGSTDYDVHWTCKRCKRGSEHGGAATPAHTRVIGCRFAPSSGGPPIVSSEDASTTVPTATPLTSEIDVAAPSQMAAPAASSSSSSIAIAAPPLESTETAAPTAPAVDTSPLESAAEELPKNIRPADYIEPSFNKVA